MKITIFDKDGNKVAETETFNDVDKENITKEHDASLSKDSTNSLRNVNFDIQDDINESEMMKVGEI